MGIYTKAYSTNKLANLFGCVAEQQLSGCNAYTWRVRGYFLKTPSMVVSTHLSILK